MTTLLLPFDGSPAATRALELLARYRAEPSALALHVLNVQARPIRLWPEATLDMNLVEAALIETGRSTIKPAIERLAADGMHVQEPLTWLEAVLPPHDDLMRQWSAAAGEAATQAARELFTRAGIRTICTLRWATQLI